MTPAFFRFALSLFMASCALAPQVVEAAMGEIISSKAAVRAAPDNASEVLTELNKGTRVEVLSRTKAYLKVRVRITEAFSFEGYVPANQVRRIDMPLKAAPPPRPAVPAAPEYDSLFEPSPAAKPTPKPAPVQVRKKEPKRRVVEAAPGEREPRGSLSAGVGFLLYQYRLSTSGSAPGALFAYNLPGFGFHIGAQFRLFTSESARWSVGSSAFFQYGMYTTNTRLIDTAGELFSTLKAGNTSQDLQFRLLGTHRFRADPRAFSVGASLGLHYSKFKGDDIAAVTGPLGLYVSARTLSVAPGLFMEFHPGLSFKGRLGSDILMLNFTSESPGGATGEDPKAGLGFLPYLELTWRLFGNHEAGFAYNLRVQSTKFKGSGSRMGASNVTDGKVRTVIHGGTVSYGYGF